MTYSTILVAILRLVFLLSIGMGIVRIIAAIAAAFFTKNSAAFSWHSMGSSLLQVAFGILLFVLAPVLARMAVGRRDGEIVPAGSSSRELVRAGIVGVGIYLIATYLPLVINVIHHFTAPVAESLPWELGVTPTFYDLFEPLGIFTLGLLYVLANARFAKHLCPKSSAAVPAG